MNETMGRNEYARHRGVAPNAVTKAVKDGRIKAAVQFEGDRIKAIDWRKADELWARNTDPVEAGKSDKIIMPLRAAAAPGGEQKPQGDDSVEDGGDRADPHGFYEGRARRMQVQAEEAELDLMERKGLLVSAKGVQDHVFEIFRQVRDRVQNVPARIAPRLAAESDTTRVDQLLSDEIALVLDELSRDIQQLAAAGAARPA
jgi:hypothetical protein